MGGLKKLEELFSLRGEKKGWDKQIGLERKNII
jgi:hypothetical protein